MELWMEFGTIESVQDITWMSDLTVHLAKWMPALEQVTQFIFYHLGNR